MKRSKHYFQEEQEKKMADLEYANKYGEYHGFKEHWTDDLISEHQKDKEDKLLQKIRVVLHLAVLEEGKNTDKLADELFNYIKTH